MNRPSIPLMISWLLTGAAIGLIAYLPTAGLLSFLVILSFAVICFNDRVAKALVRFLRQSGGS